MHGARLGQLLAVKSGYTAPVVVDGALGSSDGGRAEAGQSGR